MFLPNFMKFRHCLFKILKNQNVADGRTDGRAGGWTDRRTNEWTDGHKDGRTDNAKTVYPHKQTQFAGV